MTGYLLGAGNPPTCPVGCMVFYNNLNTQGRVLGVLRGRHGGIL